MRKTIITLTAFGWLALFALGAQSKNSNPPPNPDYAGKYTGVDVKAGVGYSGMTKKTVIHLASIGIDDQDQIEGGAGVAVQGRVGGTYGFCNHWIVGLDVYGQYNSAQSYQCFKDAGTHTHQTDQLDANVGIDFRMGAVAWPSNLFFLTVGPDWGHHKYTSSHSGPDGQFSNTHGCFLLGVRFGAGAEQKFSDHWVFQELFSYILYPSLTFSTVPSGTLTETFALATMAFSAGYLF